MAIVPDDKDWTWVLRERCPDCGHAAGEVPYGEVAAELRATASRWWQILRQPGVALRPEPDVWSPLEYGCHVRDVFAMGVYRISKMLWEDDPTFLSWDQDAASIEDRYLEQDPAVVADQLVTSAESLACLLEGVRPDRWDRAGTRSDGARFTAGSFAQYVLHDPLHHEWDVRAVVRSPV